MAQCALAQVAFGDGEERGDLHATRHLLAHRKKHRAERMELAVLWEDIVLVHLREQRAYSNEKQSLVL